MVTQSNTASNMEQEEPLLEEQTKPNAMAKRRWFMWLKKSRVPKPVEKRLEDKTIQGIAQFLKDKLGERILVLSGAGMSTNSGIPDMKTVGRGLHYTFVDEYLPHTHAVFENSFFKQDQWPLFKMIRYFMDGDFKPTLAHHFVALLERKGVLLKNYTQNMDSLEGLAGVSDEKLVQVNGTYHRFWCIRCRDEYSSGWVKDKLDLSQTPLCNCGGVIKPKIYLYGEALPKQLCQDMFEDFRKCDVLLVLGTSLTSEPVASMPFIVSGNCPRLVINATSLSRSLDFRFEDPKSRDVFWQGDCDEGCKLLAELMGWSGELMEVVQDSLNKNV